MRYRTMIIWLIVNVIVLGIGSYYVYQNQQSFDYLKIRTENMYQQAFHSLISHIKTIEDYLAKSLVVSDLTMQQEIMSTIDRQVYVSQEELGKLPLILVPLISTETALEQIADFAWQVNNKHIENDSQLTSEEWKTLVDLKKCTSQLLLNLQNVQSDIIQNNLSWVDIELALDKNEIADNTVIDGLHIVDRDVKAYSETQASIMPSVKEPKIYFVGDRIIDKNEGVKKAKQYLSLLNIEVGDVIQTIESEGDIPAFVTTFGNGVNQYSCAVTKAGGELIWIMGNSILSEDSFTLEKAVDKASEFIDKMDISDFILVGQTANVDEAVLIFASILNDVIVYPDLIKVNVSLRSGSISAVDMSDYVKYHHIRELPKTIITEEDIPNYIPKDSVVNNIQKAIIFNQLGVEVLTYEVAVSLAGENYLIYINVENGTEENILRIENAA